MQVVYVGDGSKDSDVLLFVHFTALNHYFSSDKAVAFFHDSTSGVLAKEGGMVELLAGPGADLDWSERKNTLCVLFCLV